MKKSTLSFVIASLIAPIANTSHSAVPQDFGVQYINAKNEVTNPSAPFATPVAQPTPVPQLTPVAPQLTPQAIPPRPQSTPVAQLTPVAHPQLTPLPNPVLVHNAQAQAQADASKPYSYDAGRGEQQNAIDLSRAAYRDALDQDKVKLAEEKRWSDAKDLQITQSNKDNEQEATANHLPYDAAKGEFDNTVANEKQRVIDEAAAQAQEGEVKAEANRYSEKNQRMLTAAHDAPLQAGIAQAQATGENATKAADTVGVRLTKTANALQSEVNTANSDIAQTASGVVANRAATGTNAQNIATLAQGVDHAQATGEYAQSRADAAYANTQANRQAMNATNQRVAANSAELADHESRISSLESSTSSKFADLNKEVNDNRKRASAGIAGVAAMANIPQVIQGQTFSVGAGVGTADSEQALAVGFSARATENTVVKASVSNDSQHNFVAGAGVSYGW